MNSVFDKFPRLPPATMRRDRRTYNVGLLRIKNNVNLFGSMQMKTGRSIYEDRPLSVSSRVLGTVITLYTVHLQCSLYIYFCYPWRMDPLP